MSRRSLLAHGVVAGIGVFLVDVWPVLLIWWAGASGSVGDLSELRFLGVGLVWAAVLAVLAARVMMRWLHRAAGSADLGRLDPWGAYALGVGVYNVALTAALALTWGLLLVNENQSLREREWSVVLLWAGGRLASAAVAYASARGLLGRSLQKPAEAT